MGAHAQQEITGVSRQAAPIQDTGASVSTAAIVHDTQGQQLLDSYSGLILLEC